MAEIWLVMTTTLTSLPYTEGSSCNAWCLTRLSSPNFESTPVRIFAKDHFKQQKGAAFASFYLVNCKQMESPSSTDLYYFHVNDIPTILIVSCIGITFFLHFSDHNSGRCLFRSLIMGTH